MDETYLFHYTILQAGRHIAARLGYIDLGSCAVRGQQGHKKIPGPHDEPIEILKFVRLVSGTRHTRRSTIAIYAVNRTLQNGQLSD